MRVGFDSYLRGKLAGGAAPAVSWVWEGSQQRAGWWPSVSREVAGGGGDVHSETLRCLPVMRL